MDTCWVTQGFGENANSSYADGGLSGHSGIDRSCGYGSDIHSPVNGTVIKLINDKQPARDGTGYWCIFILCETPLETFEFSIGHCSEILIKENDTVKVGDLIAKEGNRGLVYSYGSPITLAMQKAGDKRGAHRHYQKRPLIKTPTTDWGNLYLQDYKGIYRKDGMYYQYAIRNKYAGCMDFTKPLFTKTLTMGMNGYDVLLLQRALVKEGLADYEPTGFFGPKTFYSVTQLQKKLNMTPVGICGPATRAFLNLKYNQGVL